MKLIVATGPGEVELNYMWLPLFIGLNTQLKQEIEDLVGPKLVGKDLTDDTIDEAHELVLNFLEERFPDLHGLRDYLDSIKFVHQAQ